MNLRHYSPVIWFSIRMVLGLSFVLGGASAALAQTAGGAEADLLRAELSTLKQEYDQRIQQLEKRLNQLEQPVAVVGSPQVAAQGSESRLETEALAGRVQEVAQDFVNISGYFRSGYGLNDQGGSQVGFKAPGASAKYRLGNEAETYGEICLGKDFFQPGSFGGAAMGGGGPIAHAQVRLAIYNPYEDSLSAAATDFSLPEAWASVRQVMAAQPEMAFWAGSRFYRRYAIDINDFYYYNMSGTGGGVEDVELPFGKLALAWIGAGSSSGISSVPEPDAENEAGFSKANWDVRLYDVDVPLGKGELGLTYAYANSGLDSLGQSASNSEGVALTFLHTHTGMIDAEDVNRLSLQFGTGAAKTFSSGFETFEINDDIFIRPDEDDSWRLRVTEHFVANVNEAFSIGPALVYELTDYADESGQVHWASAGVRPVWYISQHFSLAAEAGVDWVKNEGEDTSDCLYKLTLAPQVAIGRGVGSRPAIRTYVTYARWGDDFVGKIGGLDYADQNEGLVYGLQMEVWW